MNATINEQVKSVFEGVVVHGNHIGRKLGFPTANLQLRSSVEFPTLNGVYSVKVAYNQQQFYGVMNIGTKPTFENISREKTFEVHILNFNADIYGATIRVEIASFIRSERKFKSVEALKKQITEDCLIAKQQLMSLHNDAIQTISHDVIHLPDLAFVRYCENHFRINRGVYNAIDQWFADQHPLNIIQRRAIILRFLQWVSVYVPKEGKLEFGSKGLAEQLQCYYDRYVATA